MTYDLFIALVTFAFVSSITPGPNNLMLMASGANFGILRTIPHGLGVGLGFIFMIMMVGLGLAQLFDQFPVLHDVLKVVSVVYLAWLAWKIGTAAPKLGNPTQTGRPLTFWQAAAFQWVNPKAWAMALTAITLYTPDTLGLWGVGLVAVVFGGVNVPCISCWAYLGVQLRYFLNSPQRLRLFNCTMAFLLILSLYPIVM
ncbi:MAG: LysE family translocator [Pseudomonadota bacterium]